MSDLEMTHEELIEALRENGDVVSDICIDHIQALLAEAKALKAQLESLTQFIETVDYPRANDAITHWFMAVTFNNQEDEDAVGQVLDFLDTLAAAK